MVRYLFIAVLGFAGFLGVPQMSQAQTPVGVQVQVGPASFAYGPGYYYPSASYAVPAPTVVTPIVVVRRPVYYPYYPWHWDGYRWIRHERWEHHYRHYRR